jgi:hypothetical protein
LRATGLVRPWTGILTALNVLGTLVFGAMLIVALMEALLARRPTRAIARRFSLDAFGCQVARQGIDRTSGRF